MPHVKMDAGVRWTPLLATLMCGAKMLLPVCLFYVLLASMHHPRQSVNLSISVTEISAQKFSLQRGAHWPGKQSQECQKEMRVSPARDNSQQKTN